MRTSLAIWEKWLLRFVLRRVCKCESTIQVNTAYLLSQLHLMHADIFYEDNLVTRKFFMQECLRQAQGVNTRVT